jgi:hypothetical protein
MRLCLCRPVHEQLSRVVRQAAEEAVGTESLLVVLAALQVGKQQGQAGFPTGCSPWLAAVAPKRVMLKQLAGVLKHPAHASNTYRSSGSGARVC